MPLEERRVGQDGEARGAALLIGEGVLGGAKVGPDQTLGRRSFLDFGDQAEAGAGLGFERQAK